MFNRSVAVLGAGLMGAGIVQVTADKGMHVILKDAQEKGLSRGYDQIYNGFQGGVKRKKLSP